MLFNTYEPWKFAFSQENSSLNNADKDSWGIIGVPFDSTTSYHTGARSGPIVVREASFGFERYNSIFNRDLNTIFYDFGDLNVVPGNCKKTCDIVEDTVSELITNNIKPIMIGGEHSITIGAVKAILEEYENLTIVHLDAHRDLAIDFIGEKYSHATVLRRIHEFCISRLIQIGIRSSSKEEENFVDLQNNITTFKAKDFKHHLDEIAKELLNINNPIYLTIDMDVLDPSFAPNVGNPTPSGLSIQDIEFILETLSKKEIVGLDVVETATNELGDITAVVASKIIYDFLSLF